MPDSSVSIREIFFAGSAKLSTTSLDGSRRYGFSLFSSKLASSRAAYVLWRSWRDSIRVSQWKLPSKFFSSSHFASDIRGFPSFVCSCCWMKALIFSTLSGRNLSLHDFPHRHHLAICLVLEATYVLKPSSAQETECSFVVYIARTFA